LPDGQSADYATLVRRGLGMLKLFVEKHPFE
jgi:hypothetical protein